MPLYEPQEDSELLASFVGKLAAGRVLDMGTGSGIQAFAAAARPAVSSVLAVDIDDDALAHVKTELRKAENGALTRKITVIKSDLFTNIDPDERFDTIVCNPPYLPAEETDDHPALYGGANGYELIAEFLSQTRTHLASSGTILLLFSSLSNKEVLLGEAKRIGYLAEELAVEYHFFEQLYVYRLRRRNDEWG